MRISYTPAFLRKLEHFVEEISYVLRYEKGNFQSGYCILNHQRIIIINKFFPLEGKINALMEIISQLPIEKTALSPENQELYCLLKKNISTT
ncbi:MAG: hypothetical protein NZM38_07960 [Cytophagales bacterium]|nr:hypothetical protein [Cytophagales bacterium]MDW8384692.1 hypothetical protein [Flammeovirgaceae bacterium]